MNLWLNSYGITLKFNQKPKINVLYGNNWYSFNQYNVNECHRLYNFHDVEFNNLDYNEFSKKYYKNTRLFYIAPPYLNSKYKYNCYSDLIIDWKDLKYILKPLTVDWFFIK
jgi:hypothetical protein